MEFLVKRRSGLGRRPRVHLQDAIPPYPSIQVSKKCYIGKTNKTFIKIRNFLTYGLILITGCKTEYPCNLDTFLSTKTMVKGKAWPALSAWEASSTSNVKSRSICSRTATKKKFNGL